MAVISPDTPKLVLTILAVVLIVRPHDQIWLGLQVGGPNQAWLFARSLRRGELSVEARTERWQRYVDSYLSPSRTKVRQLGTTAVGVVLVALVALAALVPVVSGSGIATSTLVYLVTMGLAGGVALWFGQRRERRRMARLGVLLGTVPAR